MENISKRDRFLFIGDSITDSNRNYHEPVGHFNSLGDGYVKLISSYLTAFQPENEFEVINKGINGNRIIDLKKRWDEDVLEVRPDWVSIMIGVNDVWRQFDSVFWQEYQVGKQLFKETYMNLIQQTLPEVKGIFLMSGFMIESNDEDPMKKRLLEYNQITKEIANLYQIKFIDMQTTIDHFLQYQSSYILSHDRIHPTQSGHMMIVKNWLKTIFKEGRV